MQFFSKLYNKTMEWSRHRHAPYYLFGLSFAESSFFPIPPDVMLAPMALANRKKAWWYAGITTVASVLGGIAGYILGYFSFELVQPFIIKFGYCHAYSKVQEWFAVWGFAAIFIAGFTPIPYKIFTIASGAIGIAFLPFVFASLIGRGLRFFLVAGLMYWGGKFMEEKLKRYIDRLGWATVILAVLAYLIIKVLVPMLDEPNKPVVSNKEIEAMSCGNLARKSDRPSDSKP